MSRRTKSVNLINSVIGVDFNKHKIKTPYRDLRGEKKQKDEQNKEEREILQEPEEQQSREDLERLEVSDEVAADQQIEAENSAEEPSESSSEAESPELPSESTEFIPNVTSKEPEEVSEASEVSESGASEPEASEPAKVSSQRSKITDFFPHFSSDFYLFSPIYRYFQEIIKKCFKIRSRHKGFSLIEVAIAIVVIGLVVGLSLKGKELIHTAKVNSVVDQVNAFRVATQMFTEKYGAMPGDFTDAKNSIDESLDNGNGTGLISSIDDAKRFWSHLVKSGLLTAELVGGFPVSKLGGYYSVSSEINENDGLWLVLTRGTSDNKSFSGIISQEDAAVIDRKYDNGDPSSGDIRTKKVEGSSATKPVAVGKRYDAKSKAKNCVIMFKLW